MKKQIAGAALKYAGKGMVKGFRQKASKALDKAARAARPNPGKRSREDLYTEGRAVKLNPAPRVVTHPLRVTLTAAEVKQHKQNPAAFVADLLKKAATVSQQWDHIEARGPGGRHLFDVIP